MQEHKANSQLVRSDVLREEICRLVVDLRYRLIGLSSNTRIQLCVTLGRSSLFVALCGRCITVFMRDTKASVRRRLIVAVYSRYNVDVYRTRCYTNAAVREYRAK